MSRRKNRPLVVPEARPAMNTFKADLMALDGYLVNPEAPNAVKYEVAQGLGISLEPGYNGELKTREAGKVGGQIGGKMVREMVRMAETQLAQKP